MHALQRWNKNMFGDLLTQIKKSWAFLDKLALDMSNNVDSNLDEELLSTIGYHNELFDKEDLYLHQHSRDVFITEGVEIPNTSTRLSLLEGGGML